MRGRSLPRPPIYTHPIPENQRDYGAALRRELQVILLEEVKSISPSDSEDVKRAKLHEREGIWQGRLQSYVPGGHNVRGEFKN